MLEAIGEAVYAIDRDLHIRFANRKALEWWGRTAGAAIGRHLLDVFPDIERGEPYRAYRRVLATGMPEHLETTAPALGDRWIGLDVYPGADGGLVVAFRDLEERRRSEARLKDSEERFRLMLEGLPQAAFLIGADGEAQYYNRALRDYVGRPIGTSAAARTALHHPDDQRRLVAAREAGAARGDEYTIELRLRRHDGAYRWHRIHNRPIRFAGKIEYWLGTAVDIDDMREANVLLEQRVAERTAELEAANRRLASQIDEREQAEARLLQAQRVDAMGQLTSGVAHDFNNLLTAIIGNLELLEARLDGRGGARIGNPLAAAAAAAQRGAQLTAQLLAFSRQQRMTPEPIDLNQIVIGMNALLHSTIGATTRIETALAPDLSPALADASQLELVLLNLAINARDAMPRGGTITITTGNIRLGAPQRPEEPPAGEYAMVAVADTGSGIDPLIRDRVFDPFFTTKEVGKGSGLGLSQALGLAHQLGGGMRIETRSGEGTTVSLYLPRVRRGDATERRPARHRRGVAGHRPAELLLVDDDPDVRAVAAAMLRQSGYAVIEAGSGGAALEHLEREGARIELMIADILMPGMSGVELARAARGSRPSLPILFVTGYAGPALPAGTTELGEILHKPFRTTELAGRVAALLEAADCGEIGGARRPRPMAD
ncbi:MAG TPA: PAS domain-containing protein [Stellaceae bacterium]|nr:PAS domain-containing protein [Stellaceae bacterium]